MADYAETLRNMARAEREMSKLIAERTIAMEKGAPDRQYWTSVWRICMTRANYFDEMVCNELANAPR